MKTHEIFKLSCPYNNPYQGTASRYLFVCSAGMLRSPTAAMVAASMGYNARSCGSEEYALIRLSANLIEWANKIFFMNCDNFSQAVETFESEPELIRMLNNKSTVWDLEDIYDYGNYTLVEKVKELLAK